MDTESAYDYQTENPRLYLYHRSSRRCEANVREQIAYTQAQGPIEGGPRRALIIGSSSGYGLSSRIAAAFGSGAATIGVFFEKPGSERKTGTAAGTTPPLLTSWPRRPGSTPRASMAMPSPRAKQRVIELIKQDLAQIDLVVYSLASPVRKLPDSGEVVRSALKPIGEPYRSTRHRHQPDLITEPRSSLPPRRRSTTPSR